MTNMQERLNAAVDTTEADSTLFHTIVHGDDQTVVQTENGGVPSVAKAINDLCSSISSESNNIVKIASEAAISAEKAQFYVRKPKQKFWKTQKLLITQKFGRRGRMNKWRPAAAHIPPAAGLNLRAKPRLAVIQQRSAEQRRPVSRNFF